MSADVQVRDDPERERYVALVDGEPAGFTVYHIREGGLHFFVHTEIDDAFGGMGVGTKLVRGALDDVRAKGGKIVPICPFVAGFVRRNPDYDALVDHDVYDQIAARLHPS